MLERIQQRLSGARLRSSNFEQCVSETAGCQIIHKSQKSERVRYQIHVADNVRVEQTLIRMLDTSNVILDAIETENGATYLEVVVR